MKKKFGLELCIIMIVAVCALSMIGCKHTHDWQPIFSKNDTNHWYACSGCDEKKEVQAHRYTDGVCVCGKVEPKLPESLEYELNGDEYVVVGIGSVTGTNIEIPIKYNGKLVTGIKENAFENRNDLERVEVASSVKEIGAYAFSGCSGLTDVTIGRDVESIGAYAFSDCIGLMSVSFSDKVKMIDDSAFKGCAGVKVFWISKGVASIGNQAFYGCSSLEELIFEGTHEEWLNVSKGMDWDGATGNYKESCNDSLEYKQDGEGYVVVGIGNVTGRDIVIPAEYNGKPVKKIADSAFKNCNGLRSVEISDGITSIGSEAFWFCKGLKSVKIASSVTSFGEYAFYFCPIESATVSTNALSAIKSNSLKTVVIEGGESIGKQALSWSEALTSVKIPAGVKSIGKLAFAGCSSLTSIEIPDGVTTIGDLAFFQCGGLTSVKIPNSVTTIGESAFFQCTSLNDLVIPDSVTSIGASAFHETEWYRNQSDGLVYIGEVLYVWKGPRSSMDMEIEIKDGTKVIADSAFSFYNSGSLNIGIPSSVTTIGRGAFSQCPGLTRIDFKGTVAEWNAIPKEDSWDDDTGNYTVYCTDGTISK